MFTGIVREVGRVVSAEGAAPADDCQREQPGRRTAEGQAMNHVGEVMTLPGIKQ